MTKIRVLADEQGEVFTEEEREFATFFSIDIDLKAIKPGTVIEDAQIDPGTGRAHYSHPLSKGFNPWFSHPGDFEVLDDNG